MSTATLPAVDTERIEALASELRELIGPDAVSDEEQALERASIDGSALSPVLIEQLPLGRAQLVAYPADAEQIAAVVGAAVRHGVPITPRGKGTGNYGQGIPMAGGLVLDTTKARTIIEVGDGYLIADAGAPMNTVEQAANKSGQQSLMYPSTVQSTIGGFVSGGSGGTGSIANGVLMHGFVRSLDVVHAVPDARLVHVGAEEAEAYLHNYGVAGIVARVEIALEPLQDWLAVYAAFDDYHDAFGLVRDWCALTPTPRLVSADVPLLAAALPADAEALPPGKASLRGILDAASLDEATRLVEAAGGSITAVREGVQHTMRLSMTSYNHAIEWLQKSEPNTWFHVEVSGDALVDRLDELQQLYGGAWLHIEGQAGRPIGMLAARYRSREEVFAGFEQIAALGAGYHNPHQWFVDYFPEQARALAETTDPNGLLNPGKLVAPTVDTGTKPSVAISDSWPTKPADSGEAPAASDGAA